MRRLIRPLPLVSFLLLAACSAGSPFDVPARKAGVRAPLSGGCDDTDPTRCLLPWPSNVYTVADATTATGLRVAIRPDSTTIQDDPASLNLADGFSRLTPIAVGFTGTIDKTTVGARGTSASLQLVRAQPGDAAYGTLEPLEVRLTAAELNGVKESLVTGYPLAPLAAGSDYVAVALDSLQFEDGTKPPAPRQVQVALGLAEPASLEEARLAAYHAPTRAALQTAGIAREHVVRVWDFTTRSREEPTRRLAAMRAASIAAAKTPAVQVVVDQVLHPRSRSIALVVEGRLTGLPDFLDAQGNLPLTREAPVAQGTREAPFRIVVPAGTGDYRVVMYGHGTGGSFRDESFDEGIASRGFAKVAGNFYGWTDKDVIDTFSNLGHMFEGTHHSTSRLLQALADMAALQEALGGVLGDVLSAPQIKGETNPAAGRSPRTESALWAGGSLGGTMGLVYASADPVMHYGVLNVPGAGWTHFLSLSVIYAMLDGGLRGSYGGEFDLAHAVVMAQGDWDDVDGGAWVDAVPDDHPVYLVQESMGDPVLPNPGTALLSTALHATQVGVVLDPIPGLAQATVAVDHSALTQFRVPDTGAYDVHGFAALGTPAGEAARAQIDAYLRSVVAGAPRIDPPPGCPALRGCDFSGSW